MSARWQRYTRIACRSLWLAGEVLFALIRFGGLIAAHGRLPQRAERARWLQQICRRALRVFNLHRRIARPIPTRGLLVCNHLSYLDILVLSATTPCVFVSKWEVKGWPVFGWLASLAGTLFLRRDRRSDVVRMTREMGRVLESGTLLVLFPEGTTSNGREVLPFKTSLLEAAAQFPGALAAGCIEYALEDGDVGEEVCYWKEMTLLPHLLNLFGKRGLEARLRFTNLSPASADRKQLARQLHSAVVGLQNDVVRFPAPRRPMLKPMMGSAAPAALTSAK